jgi:hypothetical protein
LAAGTISLAFDGDDGGGIDCAVRFVSRSVTSTGPVELGAGHDGSALEGDLRDLLVAGVA